MSELHGEVFYPTAEAVRGAHVPNHEALWDQADQDFLAFWEARAKELTWDRGWDTVLDDSNAPFYRWFAGARTNIVTNCIDRHLKGPYKNKLALIWVGEDMSQVKTYSYFSLAREVDQMANVIRSMGVGKGDKVTIYLPRIPEVMFAMLACAKIGAVHSVIFAGFSSDAVETRVDDSQSKLVICSDGSYINGKVLPLKPIIDDAIKHSPSVENVIVVKRAGNEVTMDPLRDHWYHDLCNMPIARGKCQTEIMDANDPLYILYTSGSTGKPKAVVHGHGGYQVGIYATLKYAFDMRDEDRWWCTADPGWVTGHSYLVYGPLLNGATSFMYEGGPVFPYPNRWWQLIEYYGITQFYTAPTAIRTLMRFGEAWPNRHDLSSLRLLGTVGEPTNPEAWKWFHRVAGKGKLPIIDTWWQTETGQFMICPTPSLPLKPGSGTKPFFGQRVEILDEDGNQVPANEEGALVLTRPWPAMALGILGDDERWRSTYWSKYPGKYTAGDAAKMDEDGYVWVIGRTDDVIKVSGHRLGTAEVESALVSHPSVTEAAAIGIPHDVKGNVIVTFVTLGQGVMGSDDLVDELRNHVSKHLSPIAKPERIEFVDKLPKTRSGKIMRRVLRARALGQPEGDLSTLEE
jgi:acetyl-CoA synthetase